MSGAPTRLKTEYHVEPLGLAVRVPRFSWVSGDDRAAERQTAWRVQVASDVERLSHDEPDQWDSGWIAGANSVGVRYQGPELAARARCCWRVAVRDSDGQATPWSDPAWFELGLLGAEDWQAQWVGTGITGSLARGGRLPEFRVGFDVPESWSSARLYLAVLGECRISINGRQLPVPPTPWSDFRCELHYQVLDPGPWLQAGRNELRLVLADGLYAGAMGGLRQQYGAQPLILTQLEVQAGSPKSQIVLASGADWQWRPSAWLQADVELGEHQLATDGAPLSDDWHEVRLVDPDPQPRLIPVPAPILMPVDDTTAVTLTGERVERSGGTVWQRWQHQPAMPTYGRVRLQWHPDEQCGAAPPMLWVAYTDHAVTDGVLPVPQDLLVQHRLDCEDEDDAAEQAVWMPQLTRRRLPGITVAAPLPGSQVPGQLQLGIERWSGAGQRRFQLQTDHGQINQWFAAVQAQVERVWLDVPRLPPDDLPRVDLTPAQALAGLQFADVAPILRRWLPQVCDAIGP